MLGLLAHPRYAAIFSRAPLPTAPPPLSRHLPARSGQPRPGGAQARRGFHLFLEGPRCPVGGIPRCGAGRPSRRCRGGAAMLGGTDSDRGRRWRPAAIPPRARSRPGPPATPGPLVSVLSFSSALPRVARSPFAAALPREDLGVLARPPPRPHPRSGLAPWGATRPVEKRNRRGKWRLESAYLKFPARLPFLTFPRSPLARLIPSPSLALRCLLTVSPSQGAPTTTPQPFSLQFPPTPSSILSLSPSHADPGVNPQNIVWLADSLSSVCLFSHCPIPALLYIRPRVWLVCFLTPCILCGAAAFRPCTTSCYHRSCPTLEPR